jgi:hypothetical protein
MRDGNLTLGIAVARQFCDRKIPPHHEGHYTCEIRIKSKADETVWEWNGRQGNIRLSLDTTELFCAEKLGFKLLDTIRRAKPVAD